MTDARQELIDDVRTRFGDRAVVTEAADIEPWLTDWRGRYHGAAAAMLRPQSTEEVAAIVRLAAERGVAAGAAGRQHLDGRRRDAARGRVGADPVAAADEPHPRARAGGRCAPSPRRA